MANFFTIMGAVALGDLLAVVACVFLWSAAKPKTKTNPITSDEEVVPETDPLSEDVEICEKEEKENNG